MDRGAPCIAGLAQVNGLPASYPAHGLDARHMPEPIEHPNLRVVGDYLFDSTLNGVLDSADFAAVWLAAEMEGPRTSTHACRTPARMGL